MLPGSIVRLRNIRNYGHDGKSYFDSVSDRERAIDMKRVFVCMILGSEPLKLFDPKNGRQLIDPLDTQAVLNSLGYWEEKQISDAVGYDELNRIKAHEERESANRRRATRIKRQYENNLPMLEKILAGERLWPIGGPANVQKKKIKEVVALLKEEHEYLLIHEPKDEYHACVLLGALNTAQALL